MDIRKTFKIPDCYDGPHVLDENRVLFSHYDSTLVVHLKEERCIETHLGLNSDATGHEFVSSEWLGLDPNTDG